MTGEKWCRSKPVPSLPCPQGSDVWKDRTHRDSAPDVPSLTGLAPPASASVPDAGVGRKGCSHRSVSRQPQVACLVGTVGSSPASPQGSFLFFSDTHQLPHQGKNFYKSEKLCVSVPGSQPRPPRTQGNSCLCRQLCFSSPPKKSPLMSMNGRKVSICLLSISVVTELFLWARHFTRII